MANTMSAQKQKIAKNLKALGLGEFDGIKVAGKYRVGSVSFKSLKEIEEYIKGVKESKEQVKEPVAPKAETVISEQTKALVETEVARQLSLWKSASISSLRWIAYTRSLDIKSRTRQPIIDALVEHLRCKLMASHGIAA